MTALADSTRSTDGCVAVKLVVGETIGQYRVTGVIGRGGMGAVYAAEHTLLGRPAAVKVLLAELSQKQHIVTRFFNEAKAATAIRHPGIVEIYDFGWNPDGSAYIVMERLQGESLSQRAARGRLPWQTALGVARQIAGALAAAHAKGIIHRDLKPDNVFLVPDPEVPGGERIKLLDFGIAKLGGDNTSARRTDTGAVIGTPTYMAPEQCRGIPVDHRADLYSLGCVIFELCAGRPPFVGEGPGDVLAAHIHTPPPRLGSLVPEASSTVERLIRHLLAKRPGDRPQSADEVIQQIDSVTSGAHRAVLRAGTGTDSRGSAAASSLAILSGAEEAGTGTMTGATVTVGAGRKAVIGSGVAVLAMAIIASIVVAIHHDVMPVDATPTTAVQRARPPEAPTTAGSTTEIAPRAPSPAVIETLGATTAVVPSLPAQAAASPPVAELVDLVIDSSPAGADIVLDDAVLGRTPFRGTVARSASDVTIVVRMRGHADKRIVARADKPITQRIKLVSLARPVVRQKDRDESVNPFSR